MARDSARPWRVKKTRTTGRIFYMNEVTGEKRWSVDASLIHRDHVGVVWKAKVRRKDGKTYYLNVLTGKKQWLKPDGFQAGISAGGVVSAARAGAARAEPTRIWKCRTNPRNGRTYYKNTVTGKGTYTKPDDSLIVNAAARARVSATAPAGAALPAPGRARRAAKREATTTRNPLAGRKIQRGAGGANVELPRAPSGNSRRASQLSGTVVAAASAGVWRARLHANSGRIFYKNAETNEKLWTPPNGATVVNRAETRMRHEILKLRKKLQITSAAAEETTHERDRLEQQLRTTRGSRGSRGSRGAGGTAISAAEAVAAKKAAKKVAVMTVELEALESELEDSRASNDELAGALAAAERALEASNVAAAAAAAAGAGSAPEEIEAMRADAEDTEVQIEALQDDLAEAQEVAQRATVATAKAKTALGAAQSAIAAASTSASAQLDDLEEELAEKNAVCETLSDELTSAQARAFAFAFAFAPTSSLATHQSRARALSLSRSLSLSLSLSLALALARSLSLALAAAHRCPDRRPTTPAAQERARSSAKSRSCGPSATPRRLQKAPLHSCACG